MVDAGYEDLFTRGDYSRLSKQKSFRISDILQATAIEVDETGTEAAAATAAVMKATSLEITRPKFFKADQPFIFVLQNKRTNEVYFLGRVYNPKD
jgi:serpin B